LAEAERLVELWERAKTRGEDLYLATLVHVQGSSYRKPGARMLVSSSGERAGTISGGCLEAEVSRKIRWLTADGAKV
jgi:xanthine/CO dehydrogenase XdhC/CoxF family maturation factor